ncbi:STAS domain-containing protein [Synechococcus sp. Nb3U1]|uniref:STAS domain-containing protein n=1 Tax=Synechococcus sp. Nb3U1 TaxID=1914529 RepID=UPI001F1CC4FD|nr:STAS domain-containing protein [Synechococcus sp. Nb3U1]MCF2972459.1 STAS domain-containing protein [Synechococcus sp. Nb3U1]
MDVSTQISPKGSPVTVVHFPQGSLSAVNAPTIRGELSRILTEQPGHLLLDLSRITLIDSMGLSVLVSAQRNCRSAGYQLKLAGLQEQAKLIFAVTRLDSIFESYLSVADALAAFPAP